MRTSSLLEKPTQKQKILNVLEEARERGANGGWVNGRYFLRELYLSQYHARIKDLEDEGVEIEHSPFKDEFGFVSYRLRLKNTLF